MRIGVGKNMDIEMEKMKDTLGKTWDQIGVSATGAKGKKLSAEEIIEHVNMENFRAASHGNAPMTKQPGPLL